MPQQHRTPKTLRQANGAAKLANDQLVQTSFRLPKNRWRSLRDLSLDERASVQSVIVRALEAEFAKLGREF